MHAEHDPFPPTPDAARARLAAVDAPAYARTRNAIDGAVTRLSPYLTHGVLTLPEVLRAVAQRHPIAIGHRFVQELGWREYFRHVWAVQGDAIGRSLHAGPLPEAAYATELPASVRQARTGVPVVDQAVRALTGDGWLHNHARMWLASYLVHLRKLHWRAGADWMLGHLLDGDLASNHLSWQWVAGTGSHRPYLFNADNVARFAPPAWHSPGSAVDRRYEALDRLAGDPAAVATDEPGAASRPAADEPAVHPRPPPDLGVCTLDDSAAPHAGLAGLAGAAVWLMHPWALRPAPAGRAAVGLLPAEAHARHPWSGRRWRFVVGLMRAQLPPGAPIWFGTQAQVARALASAASVASVAEPHLPALAALARLAPAPRLFPAVDRPCASFSSWWRRATRGLGDVQDLLDQAG